MTRFLQTAYAPAIDSLGSISGYPVAGPVTTLFGVKDELHPVGHSGLDIAADEGALIAAPAAGTVSFLNGVGTGNPSWDAIFGNTVILDHGDCYSLYGHMESPPSHLSVGTAVQVGTFLGCVGSTGFSSGPHLHWGIGPHDNPLLNYPPAEGPVGYLIDVLTLIGPEPWDPSQGVPAGFTQEGGDEMGDAPTKVVTSPELIQSVKDEMGAVDQEQGEYISRDAGPKTLTVAVPAGYTFFGGMVKEK